MANEFPYFPLYVADLLNDSHVDAMTTEEFGAYHRLLYKAWHEDHCGTLPDDDRLLAIWTRLTAKKWNKAKAQVMKCFKLKADGRWHQKRMQAEFVKIKEARAKRVAAGKLGSDVKKQSSSNAEAALEQSSSNAGELLGQKNGNAPARAYGSGSNSGFDSEQNVTEGGSGETKPDLAALSCDLAKSWCALLTRKFNGAPADRMHDIASQVRELFRQGVDPESAKSAIEDRDRNKNQTFNEFRFQFFGPKNKASGPQDPGFYDGLKEFLRRDENAKG